MAERVNVFKPGGELVSVPKDSPSLQAILDSGGRLETTSEAEAAEEKIKYDRPFEAGVVGAVDTLSFGGASALYRAAGREEEARKLVEHNPVAHGVGVAAGLVAPVPGIPALASGAGRVAGAIAKGTTGAGRVGRVITKAATGAMEGGVIGAGLGAGEMFRAAGPLDVEHIASGFKTWAVAGGLFSGGGAVLKEATDVGARVLARRMAGAGAKGVKNGEQLAADIIALRNEANSLPWKELEFTPQLKKRSLKAVKNLASHTDAPEFLAAKPWQAAKALEVQNAAFKEMLAEAPKLRKQLVEQGAQNGKRWQALDKLEKLYEQNAVIREGVKAFEAASATPGRGLAQQLLEGAIFTGGTKAASFLGPLAPIVGAKAAKVIGDLVFQKGLSNGLASATANGAARVAKIADLIASPKVIRVAAPATMSVLREARYAPPPPKTAQGAELQSVDPKTGVQVFRASGDERYLAPQAKVFRRRAEEIKAQVGLDLMTGKPKVKPKARQAIGETLKGLAIFDPKLADALETHFVRRLEFLAEKLPKRPGLIQPPGPDRWHPPTLELASFARTVAAVEDPLGAAERFAAGNATPEDADALKAVWPEMHREIQTQIATRIGALRETLPYTKRLMLSILSGQPVDPAMEPRILAVLQGHFDSEPGTEGGIQQPTPAPQFGSVSKPESTSAQLRSA